MQVDGKVLETTLSCFGFGCTEIGTYIVESCIAGIQPCDRNPDIRQRPYYTLCLLYTRLVIALLLHVEGYPMDFPSDEPVNLLH